MTKPLMCRVQTIMTKQVITLHSEDVVSKAHEIFTNHNIHHIPIVNDSSEIIGIVSLTDMNKISSGYSVFKNHDKEVQNLALYRSLRISEIMTPNPEIIGPDESLRSAVEKFKDNTFRALPVVKDNQVQGIITPYDIMVYYSDNTQY